MENYTKATLETFKAEAQTLLDQKVNFYAIFKGSADDQGVNWCSDCVAAEPNITKIVLPAAQEQGCPVLYVNCGLRDAWRNMENDVRTHPVFKVTGVPTLVYIENVIFD